MKFVQFQPTNRQYRKAFINYPFKLYRDTPQWVPPLRVEMRKIFKPKYPFYEYGEAAFFLAIGENDEVIGRIATANNHRYNEFHQSKTALFYYFEAIDNHSVVEGLFKRGFNWAKEQGLNRVIGPKGFTILDGFGMLIKGFEYQPAFGQIYNHAYYPEMVESLGFTKMTDVLTGRVDRSTQWPEKILKAAKIIEKRRNIHIPEMKTKAEMRQFTEDLKKLYNDSLADIAGNPPLTDEDMDNMVSQLLWIADPRLVKMMYIEDQPIGWMLAYPDIGRALQRIKGRLFPFGWLQILLESKRTDWIDFNGIGIIEEYRRLGVTAVLINEIYKSVMSIDQYQYGEFLQFREDNIHSLLEAGNIDLDFHKTHRLYGINL